MTTEKRSPLVPLWSVWTAACSTIALAALPLGTGYAQAPAPSPQPAPSQQTPVELSPFVVSTSVEGYMATNTISGTAMNAPLREVPMTINVITSEFLSDALVGELAQVFDYNSSITQTNRQPVDNRSGSWSIRGFRNRNTLIDGVAGGEYIPTHLIDRVEVVKGPNTLYGQSDPGGLINIVTKRPTGSGRLHLRQRVGEQSLFETNLDYDVPTLANRLRLRLLGSYMETDGWRPVDGKETGLLGLMSELTVTPATTLVLNISGSETEGIPTQRATFSFEQFPRDLNGDGDTLDIVNGENEASIRHNNTFLPRNYTSATAESPFFQDNFFLHTGVRHRFSPQVQAQYMFVKSSQLLDVIFREFNTFNPAGVAAGNHTTTRSRNITDAHILNAFLNFETGGFKHQALIGFRYTEDSDRSEGFRLRSTNAAERATLQSLINQGRRIRLNLTKQEVLSGVPFWEEELPTRDEMRRLAPRTNAVGAGYEDVTTFFLTDSVSFLEGRARVLGGVRHIRIENYSVDLLEQVNPASLSDQKDTSFQVGGVYNLTATLTAFANYATAFNPNGRNPDTGLFDPAEESRAYEAGLKFENFWQSRISGSLSYFHIEKDNVVRTDFNPFTFVADRDITSDVSQGVEAELFVNLWESWNTVINYSYIDGKVRESRTLAQGLRLEGAAPQRLTVWTSYALREGPLKGLRFGGGVVWADGPIQQFGTYNNRFVVEDGYTEVDLFARYPFTAWGKKLTAGINVDNLTDVFYIRSRAATNGPRQVIFSLSAEL